VMGDSLLSTLSNALRVSLLLPMPVEGGEFRMPIRSQMHRLMVLQSDQAARKKAPSGSI